MSVSTGELRLASGVWPFVACRRPLCLADNLACRRPFRPPFRLWPFVGRTFRLQPAFSRLPRNPHEFLGLRRATLEGHEAGETLRSPVLRVCEPPERRLQARLPAPLRAVNGQSLQAGLPATRYLRQALCSKAREIRQISKRPAEAGRRLNACPTKHPKPRSAGRQARPHDR